jgi:hypothetical protein
MWKLWRAIIGTKYGNTRRRVDSSDVTSLVNHRWADLGSKSEFCRNNCSCNIWYVAECTSFYDADTIVNYSLFDD